MSDIIYYKLLGQVERKKQKFLFRISMKRRTGGRFLLFSIFLLFPMLSLQIITLPQGQVGVLGSNIN